ncbi:hypothetical protein P389DRAFT_142732 [Cystobasidium minutum MCA 4210]|uniref:uncharacterized protein n=1 Tax=Cystobasidium minutum MCA 4210 TaxID=1397322 RepID=UPI0034CD3165|eukprot:jgi/Rhomi1/142732/e_gw1.3.732.1
MDPALFDEEEFPHDDNADGKPSSSGGGKKAPSTWAGPGGGYNSIKNFNGQIYSGMAIGGSHTWNYQPGVWKETKKEPDLWEIDYKTNKVRNHKAPAGSGAPVGTEYHWYIVAHQYVKKIDANTYETHLVGSKYKLAHKNVNSKNWDIPTVKGQRDREVFLLEDAKRRIEGLPPVLSSEKVKVDKKEKGQATLGNFFQSSPSKKRKENPTEASNGSNGKGESGTPKKALKVDKE